MEQVVPEAIEAIRVVELWLDGKATADECRAAAHAARATYDANATYDATAAAMHTSGTSLDVFPLVVIGDDSFVTTSVAGQNTQAKHVMPKADAHNDYYGENGIISTKWSYGFLCYRPERISSLLTALPLV